MQFHALALPKTEREREVNETLVIGVGVEGPLGEERFRLWLCAHASTITVSQYGGEKEA